LTIAQAQSRATQSGDIVQVGPGIYNERITLTTSGSSTGKITFRGHDGSGCPTVGISDVNSRGVRPKPAVSMQGWQVDASYVKIECFEITNNTGAGARINANRTNVDFTDNYIHDGPEVGVDMAVVSLTNMASNVYVARNYVFKAVYGFLVSCRTNCTFEDNEVEHNISRGAGDDNDYSRLFGEDITFRSNYYHGNSVADCKDDCHIDCFQTWNLGTSNGYEVARRITIDRNVCFNAHQGIILRDVSGAAIGSHRDWTVTNNIFAHGPTGSSMPWCALFEHMANAKFYHNVCASGVVGYREGTNGFHSNNIHYETGWNPYFTETGGTIVSSKNLLYEGGRTYTTGFSGDVLNANPLLVDPARDNYRIKSGSPAIDAGANVGVTADWDGASRPRGNGFDIGPFEFGNTVSTAPNPPSGLQAVIR